MKKLTLPASYYQQFNADYSLAVPGEGYGGWQTKTMDFAWEKTAVVVMHAWNIDDPTGIPECEYIPRAAVIAKKVLPGLLRAVRESGFKLFHVVGRSGYYESLPGYQRAVALAGPEPAPVWRLDSDAELARFRYENVWPGKPNIARYEAKFGKTDFHPAARPVGDEGVAANGHQLAALCREAGVNHLIYCGFAIGACLLVAPGGMLDMQRRGALCSVLRDATTAVENRETARQELVKQIELWRVALYFGFVFRTEDLCQELSG
ncbi:MAG: hypothetical protein PCFJNLEI_02120 [Verrucomicrobiae bacterium]|nr:hypothetical protein [Verrucomicrobiae bacterium]